MATTTIMVMMMARMMISDVDSVSVCKQILKTQFSDE